jgi:hypothetical protein
MYNLLFAFILMINNNDQTLVHNGEPIIFSIRITSSDQILKDYKSFFTNKYKEEVKDAKEYNKKIDSINKIIQPMYLVGNSIDNWALAIRFQFYNDKVGNWQDLKWKFHLLVSFPDTTIMIIRTGDYFSADFGIDPEDVELIQEGFYKIRAVMSVKIIESDTILTATSEVAMLEKKNLKVDKEDPVKIQEFVYYQMMRGNYDDALTLANKLFEKPIDTFEVFGYLGQIYEKKRDFENALENYIQALENLNKFDYFDYSSNHEFFQDKIQYMLNLVDEPLKLPHYRSFYEKNNFEIPNETYDTIK